MLLLLAACRNPTAESKDSPAGPTDTNPPDDSAADTDTPDDSAPPPDPIRDVLELPTRIDGLRAESRFGWAVAPLGEELLIAAPQTSQLYAITPTFGATIDATAARLTWDFTDSYETGWDVLVIPDLDGDGRDDVAVTRREVDAVRIYSTAGSGHADITTPLATLAGVGSYGLTWSGQLIANVDSDSNVCSVPLRTGALAVDTCVTHDSLSRFEGLGDLDGDGVDDTVLAESAKNTIWVVSGWQAGDVDDVGTALTAADDWWAGTDLAGPGDVDGDGYADLVVSGVGYYTNTTTTVGRVWLLRGPTLPTSLDDASVTITGLGETGYDVGAIGDLDGDGRADFGVTSSLPTDVGFNPIGLWLDPADGTHTADEATVQIVTDPALLFDHVEGAGDLDGDGFGDVLLSATWAPTDGVVVVLQGP